MQEESKLFSSPLSSAKTQTDISYTQESPSQRSCYKRFTRCSSHSRSRSKDDVRPTTPQNFYVKNVCQEVLAAQPSSQSSLSRVRRLADRNEGRPVRPSTPAKSKTVTGKGGEEGGVERELEYLRLESCLAEARTEVQKAAASSRQLQKRVEQLEAEAEESLRQNCFLLEKIHLYEQREAMREGIKQSKMNNLKKLKRHIAQQNDTEVVLSIEGLSHEVRKLQAENLILKQALKDSELALREAESYNQQATGEREIFLEELVQQLKIELGDKDELMRKMRIQLNIFQVRQAKQSGKEETLKSEELQTLKKKYTRVLKKYHEVTQELAAQKRKEERGLFTSYFGRQTDDSLSLSP